MKKILGWAGLAAALVLTPTPAAAQTAQAGQLTAAVADVTGGVLPGAALTLTSEERGVTRNGVTDAGGKFVFAQLPLGRYSLSVKLPGFSTTTVSGNLVEADKNTSVSATLKVGGLTDAVTVSGEVPIVDASNQTLQTRVRADEFQKLPIGRSYQSLVGQAPGVVGTGNVNAHGALTSNNQFFFDGINTTDPTTGGFGANLNFEAIQEVLIRTSAVSAEYGRSTGAIVEVITKSGTNQLQGSYKFLGTNDNWNKQNTTSSEVASGDGSFASLVRTKFNKVNPVHSLTAGGPIIKNRAWFFVAYENAKNTTPQRQTNAAPGFSGENYQQVTSSPYLNLRFTTQLAPTHNVWFKVTRSPTTGFVIDYWGTSAERFALTSQDQGGTSYAGQYTGVLGPRLTAEVTVAHVSSYINVVPFEVSPLSEGAPYFDQNDDRYYNGATFDGYVKRPRDQVVAAVSYYAGVGGNTHNLKFGIDWQSMNSENSFKYPTSTEFDVLGFNPVTRQFTPDLRFDFDDAPSKSKGTQFAVYVRDKFQIGRRVSVEAGVRVEQQSGHSDIDALTVDTTYAAPRLSASYALTSDSKTLLVGSYGRFHDGVLQGFSDNFAAVPQQTNYNLYQWDGSAYRFVDRVELGASTFAPNTKVTPRYADEFTVGFDRQVGSVMGLGVRYIQRGWRNFIDDVRTFNADGSVNRVVANVDEATRSYKGIEFTLDKRFANRWSAAGSYTYGRTRGNHFVDDFSGIGDFDDATCRQTTDPGLGTQVGSGFNLPCGNARANRYGAPTFDRPHTIKFNAAYSKPLGPIDLTAGLVGIAASKATYSKVRSLNVIRPGTTTASSGQTLTYYYEPIGSDRVDGLNSTTDLAIEAAYRTLDRARLGVKFEIFNLFNAESKTVSNNTAWCNSTATTACNTVVTNHGRANVRGSFLAPQSYRVTFLFRY
jgi:hypothetical protein